MQNQKKCYQNVWILSGTADGPILADKLLRLEFIVFISVVSYKAGKVYPKNNKLHIITGRLRNEKEIQEFISSNMIDFVIDATHPFALKISENLRKACTKIYLPIFKYSRLSQNKSNGKIIADFKEIKSSEVKNKNILLAIGSRSLDEVARFYLNLGAKVFARIIATPESISKGFSSCIKNSHLAILNPSQNQKDSLESYLCKFWEIDFIICRDSGGYSQRNWDKICLQNNIKFFLLARPALQENAFLFTEYDDLIKEIIITRKNLI